MREIPFQFRISIRFEELLKKAKLKRVYNTGDALISSLTWLFDDEKKLKKFMKNWRKAHLCHGCIFLHIGQGVSHNHCENKWRGGGEEGFQRIHGFYDTSLFLHQEECEYKKQIGKLYVEIENKK